MSSSVRPRETITGRPGWPFGGSMPARLVAASGRDVPILFVDHLPEVLGDADGCAKSAAMAPGVQRSCEEIGSGPSKSRQEYNQRHAQPFWKPKSPKPDGERDDWGLEDDGGRAARDLDHAPRRTRRESNDLNGKVHFSGGGTFVKWSRHAGAGRLPGDVRFHVFRPSSRTAWSTASFGVPGRTARQRRFPRKGGAPAPGLEAMGISRVSACKCLPAGRLDGGHGGRCGRGSGAPGADAAGLYPSRIDRSRDASRRSNARCTPGRCASISRPISLRRSRGWPVECHLHQGSGGPPLAAVRSYVRVGIFASQWLGGRTTATGVQSVLRRRNSSDPHDRWTSERVRSFRLLVTRASLRASHQPGPRPRTLVPGGVRCRRPSEARIRGNGDGGLA